MKYIAFIFLLFTFKTYCNDYVLQDVSDFITDYKSYQEEMKDYYINYFLDSYYQEKKEIEEIYDTEILDSIDRDSLSIKIIPHCSIINEDDRYSIVIYKELPPKRIIYYYNGQLFADFRLSLSRFVSLYPYYSSDKEWKEYCDCVSNPVSMIYLCGTNQYLYLYNSKFFYLETNCFQTRASLNTLKIEEIEELISVKKNCDTSNFNPLDVFR
jgi:hypothetical protein